MLLDVRPVFVVQDRATGAFVDINMTLVNSLRHAAKADTEASARETMHFALYDDLISCPDGYDIYRFYLPVDSDE